MRFTDDQVERLGGNIDKLLSEITSVNEHGQPPLVAPACTMGVTDNKKTVILKTKGVRNLNEPEPATSEDLYAFFSCTKSITVMGALILYERGLLELDIPITKYFPEMGNIGVLEPGILDKKTGEYLRPPKAPKTPITARHLITHTAGFSYGFIHPDYFTLITKGEKLDPIDPSMEFFFKKTPLVHEPGSAWMYGHSIDWLGFIIEKISGVKLSTFLKREVFDPIGMNSCTFQKKTFENLVRVHYRKQDESLKLQERFSLSLDPKLDLGGQGCFGTVGDYLKFIRVWLNFGFSPDSGLRILSESTVKYAIRNHLPETINLEFIGLAHNFVDDDDDDDDGKVEKKLDGWTLTGNAYCSNDLPTGRPKGSIYWGGLANLSYWIDFKNQIGGFYAVQVLPYMDESNIEYIQKFESEVYKVVDENKNTSNAKL
ncbi:hypothetical protein KGF56_003827 [Candida oxycetoniae]|uniref:Beta-lactamase-related domain-containing protein n=1 Tax=Candida oxycetoniae TaxID=497107 RepID=A0AAI9SV23_9ASCO|nr:uncharacterized protein KGF56_003827 [Candida oxycetoniae]KAI3403406.2 hypothetical protein KGF56_003827 [Candida oxycetoniae]